ncbi:MAG: GtrA family protein [Steroidobacteraceae bacterium]|nr:GtrA family protein [Steroidobacteraceae bacterium]
MAATLAESARPLPAAVGLGSGPAELAIVVPPFNESANVGELVARLARVLDGHARAVVFVDDDSPDGTSSPLAQAVATVATMVFNFAVNNGLTYRDRRLRGARWWLGLASFMAVCSVGAVANVGSASYLFEHVTGWAVAGVAGILIGAVWNYAVTGAYTWGGRRSRAS